MLDYYPQLLITCSLMFGGALGAGCLPFLLQVSEAHMLLVRISCIRRDVPVHRFYVQLCILSVMKVFASVAV